MKEIKMGAIGGSFTESAEELYGYQTMQKMIDGILDGKTAFRIVEECRPAKVKQMDWAASEVAKLLLRLLLRTGVRHSGTNLLKDEVGLGERILRDGDVENVVLIMDDGKWTLRVTRIIPCEDASGQYVIRSEEERSYGTYAEAVDDWLWATM